MTDSELLERMNDVFRQINDEIEVRGGMLELDRKADLRWTGIARLPAGKLLIHAQKTGRQAVPQSKKPVAEVLADLTLEGRLIARLIFFAENTQIELPGGGRRPFDHAGIVKVFTSL